MAHQDATPDIPSHQAGSPQGEDRAKPLQANRRTRKQTMPAESTPMTASPSTQDAHPSACLIASP